MNTTDNWGITSGHGGATLAELQSNNILNPAATSFLNSQSGYTTSKPKAFINWVLFDEQFKYVAASSNFEQVGADNTLTTHTFSNLTVSKTGYLYIYVSNETPNVDVFFDNLTVTHVRGAVLEETHYYPFGLTMAGISGKALAYGNPENKHKYQNYEFNSDFDLNLYESFYRTHDPQLGRFWQIDLKPNVMESQYLAMGNNPGLKFDILGDTTGINLYDHKSGKQFHEVANNSIKEEKKDGNFIIYGHGNSRVLVSSKDGEADITMKNGKDFINEMSARSPEFKSAIEEKQEMTIKISGCNIASKEFDQGGKMIKNQDPIAYMISRELPNATIIAPDGYVVIGRNKKGEGVEKGLNNYKNDAGYVKIVNGKEVGKEKAPQVANPHSKSH